MTQWEIFDPNSGETLYLTDDESIANAICDAANVDNYNLDFGDIDNPQWVHPECLLPKKFNLN